MQISTIRKKWYDSYLLQKVQQEQRSAASFLISTFHLSLNTEQRVEQQGVTAALSCRRAFHSPYAHRLGLHARERERETERERKTERGREGERGTTPTSPPPDPTLTRC